MTRHFDAKSSENEEHRDSEGGRRIEKKRKTVNQKKRIKDKSIR